MDRGAWWATVHGIARVGHDLVTRERERERKRKREKSPTLYGDKVFIFSL